MTLKLGADRNFLSQVSCVYDVDAVFPPHLLSFFLPSFGFKVTLSLKLPHTADLPLQIFLFEMYRFFIPLLQWLPRSPQQRMWTDTDVGST